MNRKYKMKVNYLLICVKKRCLKSCFTKYLHSGRIFLNFPATLAGKV
jgi:hypothetical protein